MPDQVAERVEGLLDRPRRRPDDPALARALIRVFDRLPPLARGRRG